MPIALVISDVDGTLVTSDKRLTRAAIDAVGRLDAAGIAFTVASSRPPIGMKSLVAALRLRLPMGAFNGSTLAGPDLSVISEELISEDAAVEAVAALDRAGVDAWVFSGGVWHLRDADAPYADLERRTLGVGPTVVSDLRPLLGRAAKIVGVSCDFAGLGRIEADVTAALGARATVHRSQDYYLDVTPPGTDKGRFVTALCGRLGVSPESVATIGDGANDVAMFEASGFSIAMGNAHPKVRAAAKAVTRGNDEEGFAHAINEIVLKRA